MSYLELIEAEIGKNPDDIDPGGILLDWYGPNSLACHLVRPIDEKTFDAYFRVPQLLCGPQVRPPMFDRITFDGEKLTTQTGDDDAKEHLIKEVGKGVVPGHNLVGLISEGMILVFNQNRSFPRDMMITKWDFIRYKGLVLPQQELVMAGDIRMDDRSVELSPEMKHNGDRRALGSNFRVEVIDDLDEETRLKMLLQHWYPELTAQGLGVAKSDLLKRAGKLRKGVVPVLLETGKAWYTTRPVVAENLVRSRLELFNSVDTTAYGNSQFYVGEEPIGGLEKVLVEFIPIEKVFPSIS